MAQYKGAASEAGRAMQLKKKREKQLEEIELRRKKIEEVLKLSNIETKFSKHHDSVEQQKVSNRKLSNIFSVLDQHCRNVRVL